MNQNRRIRGSLLERAAEAYDFGHAPIVAPFARQPLAPVIEPTPEPAMPAPEPIVVRAPEPVAAPTPEPKPLPMQTASVEPRTVTPPVSPTPAAAPRRAGRVVAIDRDDLAEQGMLVPGAHVDALAEEFRLVKRQLLLTARAVAGADADRARMILVCSGKPNEGKTFCAINLALSMAAEKDVEILLVDADFAKPDVLGRLGVSETTGLLDVFADPTLDIEDCVIATDIPNLSILPAGTKSSSDTELLASDRARALIAGLATANKRRIVIFDSPPALVASPASVLALHVGQIMLVVRADVTTDSDIREAVALLDGCEHIQLVLNSVSFNPGGRRFGSYYGQESTK